MPRPITASAPTVIEVCNVVKEFRLGTFHGLRNLARRALGRSRAPNFRALDDVSFSVRRGEVVGIVGHNGAGKSTLLKLLSNISQPTSGRVRVHGRVAPLIEVGAGMVGDMTGRENIYLNGAILGIDRAELDRNFDEIVDFAELARFIDTPMKRYSSGMQVRLGFAIATAVESDILIVDEVLAVGDVAFQRKCLDRLDEIIHREQRTVLVVSHQVRQLERFCSRVILLDRGRLVMDGEPAAVCGELFARSNDKVKQQHAAALAPGRLESDLVELISIGFGGPGAQSASAVAFGEPCELRVRFRAKQRLRRTEVTAMIHTTDFVYLTAHDNVGHEVDLEAGVHEAVFAIDRMALYPGVYQIRLWIGDPLGREAYSGDGLFAFDVVASDYAHARRGSIALVDMPGRLMLTPVAEGPGSRQRAAVSLDLDTS